MAYEVTLNKQGQVLGRKGQETRRNLMAATRRLLCTSSPVDITAVAIAKVAGTSSASFYMYFDDVQDVLFALSLEAAEDMEEVIRIMDEPWDPDNFESEALRLVEALNSAWARNREVLRYRNLEADRGDQRFEELRMNTYIPFIERFAQRILSINPPGQGRRKSDAYAEATVLHAAIERLAATDPVVMERGLGSKRINAASARIIVDTLRGRAEGGKARKADGRKAPAKDQPTQAGTD
jgi:AcrR family transcriptional regulator